MIQSVDRALRILLALQGERYLGVTDLADRLGLAKGTVHGLLQTMAERSVVEQDPVSGKYMLGPALLVMGNVYLNSHDLRVRSLRWAASLSDNTGLSVRVGVLVWPEVVVVHHVAASTPGTPVSEVGLEMPAHATCLGKAMLAFRADREKLLTSGTLRTLTGATITDPQALLVELGETTGTAIAYEREEAVVGESGVAATVFDAGGRAAGAVSVVVPTGGDAFGAETVAAVRDAARSISREMGARTWPAPQV